MLYDLIAEVRKERNGAARQDEIVIHIPLNRTTLVGIILFIGLREIIPSVY